MCVCMYIYVYLTAMKTMKTEWSEMKAKAKKYASIAKKMKEQCKVCVRVISYVFMYACMHACMYVCMYAHRQI